MFHCSIGNQSYAEIYEFCTNYIVIDKPELPNRVCQTCEAKLISNFNFRMSIEEIEGRLQAYLVEQPEEIEQDSCVDMLDDETTQYSIDSARRFEELVVETIDSNDEDLVPMEDDSQYKDEAIPFEVIETVKSSCRFTVSQSKPKEVKCVACVESCEVETMINTTRPEEPCPIVCECEKVFKNRRSFVKHYSLLHNQKDSTHSCKICTEVFKSWRSKVAHEANAHNIGFKFECSNCKKKFYRSDHWQEHEKTCNRVNESGEKFFACSVCLFTFQREETFKKHLETAHVGVSDGSDLIKRAEDYAQKYSSRSSIANETSTDESEVTANFVCETCNKVFKTVMSRSRHISAFHSNQVWSCDKCDAVFVHRSTKISHMSKEHGFKKPFECSYDDCEFSCFKKDRFTAHMNKHENPDKTFACPICAQEFKSYNSMTHHRSKHLTKNTFMCSICSKQFLDKRNYNVHMKLHTGEGLYTCSLCSRGFNRKEHLQKHQLRKHGIDESKCVE